MPTKNYPLLATGEEDVPPGKEASAAAIDTKLQNLLAVPSSSPSLLSPGSPRDRKKLNSGVRVR